MRVLRHIIGDVGTYFVHFFIKHTHTHTYTHTSIITRYLYLPHQVYVSTMAKSELVNNLAYAILVLL